MPDHGDITELLLGLDGSNPDAVDRVLPRVYEELKAIAAARLRSERPDHTLSATALVHEAYLKLVRQESVDWKNRAHFFAIAARAMRRILLDHAISRKAQKRGGDRTKITLGDQAVDRDPDVDDLIAIDEALAKLAELDPRQERVVELRFFAGLSLEEIASVLHVSLATVNRDWRTARAFLTTQLTG